MTRPKLRSKSKKPERGARRSNVSPEASAKPEPGTEIGAGQRRARESNHSPHTLIVDIGGTGVKTIVVDALGKAVNERARELTPDPATPGALFALIETMAARMPAFDRVSVGFPGVVMHGVIKTAPNLGTELWAGVQIEKELSKLLSHPVRVINDADLQGYGVVRGQGVELVLTLGTGLGSALFVDGQLVDNLELGHHPFRRNKTYEQRISDKQLKRIGARRWTKRVFQAIRQIEQLFNYDHLHVGGGNVPALRGKPLENVSLFDNVQGMKGGLRLWEKDLPAPARHARVSAPARKALPVPNAAVPLETSDGAARR